MGIGQHSLGDVSAMTRLRHLQLDIALRETADLANLRSLVSLVVAGVGFSRMGSALELPRLRELRIDGISAAELARLSPSVTSLSVSRLTGSWPTLAASNLTELSIGFVERFDLAEIASLRELAALEIHNVTRLEGLKVLLELPALVRLEFEDVRSAEDVETVDHLELDYFYVQGAHPFSLRQLKAWNARGVAGNRTTRAGEADAS